MVKGHKPVNINIIKIFGFANDHVYFVRKSYLQERNLHIFDHPLPILIISDGPSKAVVKNSVFKIQQNVMATLGIHGRPLGRGSTRFRRNGRKLAVECFTHIPVS